MPDPAPELFATPADASRRADALSERWNALQNQALGPGARERGDVPSKLQNVIVSDRKRFRSFIRSPTFGLRGALLPHGVRQGDYETLQRWYAKYALRARQLADALPGGEPLSRAAAPAKLPQRDSLQWLGTLGGRVATAVIVVLVVAGIKQVFSGRSRDDA